MLNGCGNFRLKAAFAPEADGIVAYYCLRPVWWNYIPFVELNLPGRLFSRIHVSDTNAGGDELFYLNTMLKGGELLPDLYSSAEDSNVDRKTISCIY